MAKVTVVTVETREIYQITVKKGEYWGDVLDNALTTFYTTGVEIDEVTLLNADVEVLDEQLGNSVMSLEEKQRHHLARMYFLEGGGTNV
jgi:2-phospho-L-lactate guanylyltransferase (CobY/MobA/RfbA family)